MLTLAAAGQPRTTTACVRMARDIGGRPADVAGEKFVAWFGRQTGWTIETRRSYRASIRGSFRWAYRTKRVPGRFRRNFCDTWRCWSTRCDMGIINCQGPAA